MDSSKHIVTEENKTKVKALAACGVHSEIIAKYLSIDPKTLRKYYSDIILKATTDRVAQVGNALFDNAVRKNNVAAQIFYLKCQGRWKEPKNDDEDNIQKESLDILQEIMKNLPD